jgi:signal transduction histidine kinase
VSARAVFAQSWSARIVARFAGLFAALMALAFVGVWLVTAQTLRAGAEAELGADLASFSEAYAQRLIPGLREAVERRAAGGPAGRRAVLFGQSGETLAGDPAGLPPALREAREPARALDWIGAGRALPGGFALLVAHDRARDAAQSRALALALSGLWLVAALFGLVGGLVVGRGALARVAAINAALEQAAQGDLAARAPDQDAADEFGALARGVNAALTRLAALVAGLKSVAERIAHEMRSPLGHLRAGLADARAGAADEAQRARLDDLREEADEMLAVFGALLDVTLTEASAGDRAGFARVDLLALAHEVAELYEAVAQERGVEIAVAGESVALLGDARLLTRLLANLVDNAVKFSPAGARVEIELARRGAEAAMSVRDHGPGLPEGFSEKAFELFARAPQAAATPGHGLGLTLARAIAVRHGLKIRLENAAPGLRAGVSGPAEG